MASDTQQTIKERALKRLRSNAKRELGPDIRRLHSLSAATAHFQASNEIAKDFAENFDSLSLWARHGLTLAMVVEFAKPWSGNNDRHLGRFPEEDDYLAALKTDPSHFALRNFRDEVAAHTDKGVQPVAVVAVGAKATNDRPVDNRYDEAFVSFKLRVEYAASLGIDERTGLDHLQTHIAAVLQATYGEMSTVAHRILDELPKYAPILQEVEDLILETVPNNGRMPDATETGFHTGTPADLPIQNVRFKRVLGLFESKLRIEQSSKTSGIALNTQQIEDENGTYNVAFGDIDLNKV